MQRRSLLLSRRFVPYRESSGWEYSFATVSPAKKKAYPCRADGGVREVPYVGRRRDVVHGQWTRCLCRFLYRGVAMVGMMLAMRLRLSDATTSAVLAEHYRAQAEMCHQMARMTVSPFKEGWLEFAAEWTKLAQEQEEKATPTESEMHAGEPFSDG